MVSTINGKIKSFRDLKIWQKGIYLVEEIYTISRSFPKEEIYGLKSQMRRSAVSIPSNVAEGFQDFIIGNTETLYIFLLEAVQN